MSDRGVPGRPDPLERDPLLGEAPLRDERVDERRVVEEEVSVVASEEQLVATAVEREAGKVRIRKELEEVAFDELVPYAVEHAEIERVAPHDDDSGDIETMADGTVSIPVLEEQLVIEKRLVVTERLLVRKRVETREQRVTADLVREVVTVDSDEDVDQRVHIRDEGV